MAPFPSPYLIRPDTEQDAESLCALLHAPGVFETSGLSEDATPARLAELIRLRGPDERGLVAVSGGLLLGCAMLFKDTDNPRRAHAASLSAAVYPTFWRQGVARALLSRLIEAADDTPSLSRLEIHVFDAEQGALSLYKSLGFQVEGSLEGHTLLRGQPARVLSLARACPSSIDPSPLR